MHHNAGIGRKKFGVLGQLCRNSAVVCLQEVRACEADLVLAGGPFLRTHSFVPSLLVNRHGQIISDAGGVACLVDKTCLLRLTMFC